ncbi:8432_t:CDS:2 [Cetraspora pellucida]|uniref:8432_t:CDS:1 n=1 Tax=Cetraspora pellucida TaxID=1433469 RepID=A0A9N9PB32_9GLOM|nr:8432_t:CDS:2 [Cetraspora pellucida]
MSHHSEIKKHESTSTNAYLPPVEDSEDSINTRFYMYNIYEHVFNDIICAPVQEKLQTGAKVLEFCCDSGIWTTEIAPEYPNTEFYAVDSTISISGEKFNNITFIECDIFKKLPFPDNEFDYIVSQDKLFLMEKNRFLEGLSEIIRVLKPEGWLEFVGTYNTDLVYGSAYKQLKNTWESWLRLQNIDSDIVKNIENYLQQTGKVESISCQTKDSQIRSGNAFGEFLNEFIFSFYRSTRDYLAPFMSISLEEFDDLVNKAECELSAKDNQTTIRHKQILAKKKSMHSEATTRTVSSTE